MSTGFSVIQVKCKKANSKFVYYFLTFDDIVDKLNTIAEGSTSAYPSLKPSDIEKLDIPLPPLTEQKTIAEILSSLDDKIELLHRQNKTLEDMAQTLFQKWFVEDADEGWEKVKLSDLADHKKLNIKPSKGLKKYYFHYSIPAFDNGKHPIKELGTEIKSNKYQVFDRSILISKLNPRIPRIWPVFEKVNKNAVCSTEFQVVFPKIKEAFSFIYFFLNSKTIRDKLTGAAKGTSGSHQRVSPKDIFNLRFKNPHKREINYFYKKTEDFWKNIFNNQYQIKSLEALRDTLLPRLMSGSIRVR